MSVLSNIEIGAAVDSGHVVCRPLVPENIRGSSIDLTLGEWFYHCQGKARGPIPGVYNPFSSDDVERYFGQPQRAQRWPESFESLDSPLEGIPREHPIILVPAKSRILAHTHEFIGINPPGTTEMRARSSWGRNGIAVCLCAGWGDPGFIYRWTMEIHNYNDEAVPLPVGERIAQLIFHRTGPVRGHYGDDGKYQTGTDIEDLMRAWKPEHMLPRAYTDERALPLPLDTPISTYGDPRT